MQSFVCTIIEAQLVDKLVNPDGSGTALKNTLDNLNLTFTILFTVDLAANAFSNWLMPFISNGWSFPLPFSSRLQSLASLKLFESD